MATIDWQQTEILRAEMGDEFDHLLGVFLEEVDEGLERLDCAEPGEPLADALHFLKGSALNLGLSSFARLCSDCESAARRGLQIDRKAVRDELAISRATLLEGLNRRAA